MTIMKKLILILTLLTLAAVPVSAQTYLTSTTLSSAVTSPTQTQIVVASATGIAAGGALYVDHELMIVTAVSGTTITVTRFQAPNTHAASSTVIIIPAAARATALVTRDPRAGSCTLTDYQYLPIINTDTGNVWLCRYIGTAVTASRVWAATNITAVNGQTSLLLNLQ